MNVKNKDYKFAVLDKENELHIPLHQIDDKVKYINKKAKISAIVWEEGMHQFVYWLKPSVGHDVPEDELQKI